VVNNPQQIKLGPFVWQIEAPFAQSPIPLVLWKICIIFLLTYAAFRIVYPDLGRFADSVVAVLGFIAIFLYLKPMHKDIGLWLLLSALLIHFFVWSIGTLQQPDLIKGDPDFRNLARLYIFIPIAVWLAGSTRNTFYFWTTASIGLVLATFWLGGVDHWMRGLEGKRVDFEIHNAQHAGVLLGILFLGIVAMSKRIILGDGNRIWRVVFWAIALIFSLVGVVVTQTRAVWLGVVVALVGIAIAVLLFNKKRLWQKRSKHVLFISIIFITLAICVGWVAKDAVQTRIAAENQVVQKVISDGMDDVPFTSIGVRLHSWVIALDWIEKRPILGWGGNKGGFVLAETKELPQWVRERFGHLHNSYLELLVSYGLIGLFVVLISWSWVVYASYRAWRAKVLPNDVATFGVGFMVFWVIVNFFESYVIYWSGNLVLGLIFGGFYTHYLKWKYKDVVLHKIKATAS